jgi:outer membrane lipoprotein-sorting protein
MVMKREAPVRRYLIALPLLGVLFAACSSPSPVDEIVTSNIDARGGSARIQALQSYRATGMATASGGRIARVVYEIKRPGLFRLEFSSQGTKSVFAHDGETGWQVAPLEGQFEPQSTTPETDHGFGNDERDIEGPLLDWREKGHLVELVGRETLAGGQAFKLKVTLEDGSIRHDYIDVESRQNVRSEFTRTIRGVTVLLVDTFSDFREVDGFVFPHLIETNVRNRPEVIRIVVEEIELDPDLDDARFQFPR